MWREELKLFDWVSYCYILTLGFVSLGLIVVAPLPNRDTFLIDASFWRPYIGDTIPVWLLAIFVAFVSILVFFIELFACRQNTTDRAIYAATRAWLGFIMLNVLNSSVTSFLKIFVAEARPDFLSICLGSASVPPSTYSADNINTLTLCDPSADPSLLRDGRQAWPSGHASTASATALFLLGHAFWRSRKLSNSVRQLIWSAASLPTIIAFLITGSRINDGRHSPADVTMGFVVGVVCALGYMVPQFHSMDEAYYNSKYLLIHSRPERLVIDEEGTMALEDNDKQQDIELEEVHEQKYAIDEQ